MSETPPGVPQLNPVVHDELTGLSKQLEKLQAWSPVLPPTDNDMDQATRDSKGEHTVRCSKALSETETIGGPDMQEIDDNNEEMDKGEANAMPSAPPLVGPKEATPKKDETQC